MISNNFVKEEDFFIAISVRSDTCLRPSSLPQLAHLMRSILLLSAFFWAMQAVSLAEKAAQPVPELDRTPPKVGHVEAEEPNAIIPEPTATLLAGLGGLALLFFATRRKMG